MDHACTATEISVDGIQAVCMENEWLKAVILVGKGTDIWQLTYKPLKLELLMRTRNGLSPLAGRDLRKNRLLHYAELYAGGWQEILPNRASFASGTEEVGQQEEGESAGVPWEYSIERGKGQTVSLCCRLSLPCTPLTVEKTISLSAGESELRIVERVVNTDRDTIHFIWTHHPAFGGALIDEQAQVILPEGSVAFNVLRYEQNREAPIAQFEEDIGSVILPGGNKKNLRKIDARLSDGEACYMPIKSLNEGMAAIYNPGLNVRLELSWDLLTFPCLRYWSNNNDEIYTIALEPSTSWFSDIHDCINHSNCLSLKPMEERQTWLTIRVEQP
ncbi:MAG: DUF4432 family protein [Gorillibacterium sp.]|nr:DUF4432 family protein [Gorillibacterium sp.]